MRIPITENFIFYVYEKLGWMASPKYEYCDPWRALDRGVGVCSQAAMVLSKLLEIREIENRVVAFEEHVVVEAQVDKENDEWWIFDPDYGVTIETDLKTIKNHFDDYKIAYENSDIRGDEMERKKTIDSLSKIYTEQNTGIDMVAYINTTCANEIRAYQLKWLLPVILILTGFGCFLLRRFNRI